MSSTILRKAFTPSRLVALLSLLTVGCAVLIANFSIDEGRTGPGYLVRAQKLKFVHDTVDAADQAKVALRQYEVFGERTRLIHNSQNSAFRAVPSETFPAPRAVRTGEVNFSHYALAKQFAIIRRYHLRYKFVTGYSTKSVVPPLKFQICITNTADQ